MIAVPSFGMASLDFFMSLQNTIFPSYGMRYFYWPQRDKVGKDRYMAVDDARNTCVKEALRIGCKYIYFRDDDVIDTNPKSLMQLLERNADIIGGVYCKKQKARPVPLIYKGDCLDGFTDWSYGDVFKVDGIGMGLTLIKTEVFKNISYPWFRTIRGRDYEDPTMASPTATGCTEDLYFCAKARKSGYDVWVDTGLQAKHYDKETDTFYFFNPASGLYGRQFRDASIAWNPSVFQSENTKKEELALRSNKPTNVKYDLGNTGKRSGYVTVDLNGDPDEKGDITKINWLIARRGLADEVYSSHALEHLSFRKTAHYLRSWVKALKPGGKLKVGVPDFVWCLKNWLDAPEVDPLKYDWKMALIFGLQSNEEQAHKAGFTIPYLEALAKQLPLKNVTVTTEFIKGKHTQPTLWLEGTKKGVAQVDDRRDLVRFALGERRKTPGLISVDLNEGADEIGDATDIKWLTDKYGLADEIHASHMLEHVSHKDTEKVLKNWIDGLKPGGELFLAVPDLEWMVKDWLAAQEQNPHKWGKKLTKIYGEQRFPGDAHQTGFTKVRMLDLLKDLHVDHVRVDTKRPIQLDKTLEEGNDEKHNLVGILAVTARKKIGPSLDSTQDMGQNKDDLDTSSEKKKSKGIKPRRKGRKKHG